MAVVTDPRIGAYIARAAPFAQPILRHVRALVHRGCPEAKETMRWGMPSFDHEGVLCIVGAFKAHCIFVFWHHGMKPVLARDGRRADDAMGSFGRMASRADLPPDRVMLRYLRAAAKLNESGAPARPGRKPRPALPVPKDLAAGLKKNSAAKATFAELSPSQRREYIEWLTGANREDTRQKRLAITLAWLTEGKTRNWQYAKG